MASVLDLFIVLFDIKDIRIVYEAVSPIDKIIMIDKKKLNSDLIIVSMIVSFEKNPEVNGIAINIILDNPRIEIIRGELNILILIIRISW